MACSQCKKCRNDEGFFIIKLLFVIRVTTTPYESERPAHKKTKKNLGISAKSDDVAHVAHLTKETLGNPLRLIDAGQVNRLKSYKNLLLSLCRLHLFVLDETCPAKCLSKIGAVGVFFS